MFAHSSVDFPTLHFQHLWSELNGFSNSLFCLLFEEIARCGPPYPQKTKQQLKQQELKQQQLKQQQLKQQQLKKQQHI